MSVYDADGHHPSQSIPNAAYPDSPYQPGGTGTQNQEPRLNSSPYHSHPNGSSSHQPPPASLPSSSTQTLSHLPPTSQWSPTDHQNLPQEPPPPYDASPSSNSGPNHTHTIPLRAMPSPHDQQFQQQQPLVNSYYTSGEGTKTASLTTDAILRRRRRTRLFILLICVFVIGFAILAIGVGVAKAKIWDHANDRL